MFFVFYAIKPIELMPSVNSCQVIFFKRNLFICLNSCFVGLHKVYGYNILKTRIKSYICSKKYRESDNFGTCHGGGLKKLNQYLG